MTEEQDQIRLKDLLDIFNKEDYKELIEILDRDQKRYHSEQLRLYGVVSSFLDNIKDSDSKTLLEMKELNQNQFAEWCAIHPYAGVDDEWENELMFMRDVAKYAESVEV